VDAYAELNAAFRRYTGIALQHSGLHLDGAPDSPPAGNVAQPPTPISQNLTTKAGWIASGSLPPKLLRFSCCRACGTSSEVKGLLKRFETNQRAVLARF
jgi:hypothetical protein